MSFLALDAVLGERLWASGLALGIFLLRKPCGTLAETADELWRNGNV
jgi:hypothetical protein